MRSRTKTVSLEDSKDLPDFPAVEMKVCASHLGCHRSYPIGLFNLSAGVCNECANRLSSRLGIGYEEVGAAIVAHRFVDWYTERHSVLGPLTVRQRVRVMILASDPEAVVNGLEAFERSAAKTVREGSEYLKASVLTPTVKSLPPAFKRFEPAKRIPPGLENLVPQGTGAVA